MPGRVVFIGALIVALPWVVLAGEGLEKIESSGDPGVVEVAAGDQREPGMSPVAVTVFDREDIETSGASSVPDLLRLVPGMEVVAATPFYQSVSSRLPWTDEGNRFLVLVDGQEVNLEVLGLVPWEIMPLSLDDVERIEVVRGPISSVHGAGALAGAIRITTRIRPAGSAGWVGLAGGERSSLGGGRADGVRGQDHDEESACGRVGGVDFHSPEAEGGGGFGRGRAEQPRGRRAGFFRRRQGASVLLRRGRRHGLVRGPASGGKPGREAPRGGGFSPGGVEPLLLRGGVLGGNRRLFLRRGALCRREYYHGLLPGRI